MVKSTSRSRRANGVRAVIYVRQSAARERDETMSPANQARIARGYCERQGYKIVKHPDDPKKDAVFEDLGLSGLGLKKRKSLHRVLAMIESGEADVIVVWRFSRLSRLTTHRKMLRALVKKAGGRVESATENNDDVTASDKLTLGVLGEIDEHESRVKSEIWLTAHEARTGAGVQPGGRPVFGYDYQRNSEGKPIKKWPPLPPVPVPKNAAAVREAYQRYIAGDGDLKIAKWLNSAGFRTVNGKDFSVGTVKRMLENPFYAGFIRYHPQDCPDPDCLPPMDQRDLSDDASGRRCSNRVTERGIHKPIIDQGTWATYQRARKLRSRQHPKTRAARERWWLGGGKTVCARCGANIILSGQNGKHQLIACSAYKNGRTCEGVFAQRGPLDTAVMDWLDNHWEYLATQASKSLGDRDDRARLVAEREELNERHREVDEAIERVVDSIGDGVVTREQASKSMSKHNAEQERIEKRIAEIESELAVLDAEISGDEIRRWERLVQDAAYYLDDEEFDEMLTKTVKLVELDRDKVTVYGWRGEPTVLSRHEPPFRSYKDNHKRQVRGERGRFVKAT